MFHKDKDVLFDSFFLILSRIKRNWLLFLLVKFSQQNRVITIDNIITKIFKSKIMKYFESFDSIPLEVSTFLYAITNKFSTNLFDFVRLAHLWDTVKSHDIPHCQLIAFQKVSPFSFIAFQAQLNERQRFAIICFMESKLAAFSHTPW